MICFNCEEEGHIAADCTWRAEISPVRPDPLAMYRRNPDEISRTPHEWADSIRHAMGWPPPDGTGRARAVSDRALAARQVAEFRASPAYPGTIPPPPPPPIANTLPGD
jgi:hypothetical protein